MTDRGRRTLLGVVLTTALVALPVAAAAQGGWTVPRTPEGRPDLQGNWSNATMTPIQRPQGSGPTLTVAQVEQVYGVRARLVDDPHADVPLVLMETAV